MKEITDYKNLKNLINGKKILAVDLETTGLIAKDERVIEYGSVLFGPDGNNIGYFDALINPDRSLPDKITEITGLKDDDLKYCSQFGDTAQSIMLDLTNPNTIVIAHNAKFDIGFLVEEFKRLNVDLTRYDITYFCTRNFSKYCNDNKLFDNKGSNGLKHLMEVFGIDDPHHHRSINDCYMCYNLLRELIKL